jgi:hypothetical protein
MTTNLEAQEVMDDPEDLDDPLADPVLREAVDQAVEPYRTLVSPASLQAMRVALADVLVMHPVTDRLIRRLRPRTRVTSGEERR